jgi:hypothetical protein
MIIDCAQVHLRVTQLNLRRVTHPQPSQPRWERREQTPPHHPSLPGFYDASTPCGNEHESEKKNKRILLKILIVIFI